MKKRVSIALVLLMFLAPAVIALETDPQAVDVDFTTEPFEPVVWMCDHRVVYDDLMQPGKNPDPILIERQQNYAFEGEQIQWDVLVLDKNKIDQITDVYVSIGSNEDGNNQKQVECQTMSDWDPDGRTLVDLCQRENEKTGGCVFVGGLPRGTVEYMKYAKQFIVTVDLYGLDPAETYQLALEGTAGSDGNDGLASACPNPNSGTPWECGYWAGAGFYNFDMAIVPQANGEYHKTYTIDLALGHYENIKFIVKLNDNTIWFNFLRETEELEWWISGEDSISPKCNAQLFEAQTKIAEFNPQTMGWYRCLFTVETPEAMSGEYWVTIEVDSTDGHGVADEKEYWFFNPEIALGIDGSISFGTVRPGTPAYSNTIRVSNAAEPGSGVMMDMFIAGTNFYDPNPSPAMCPITNQLDLDNFAYYASSGAYTTGSVGGLCVDIEGYSTIPHGTQITSAKEVIGCQMFGPGVYQPGNVLSPESEMAITFRLNLPEPCVGDFSSGSIFFWGEAI